jgi:transglutaminase-like putative cysteine protease
MARTALLSLLPALLIVTGWQGLEEPVSGGALAAAALLAVLAAIVPTRRLRIGASIAAAFVVAAFAFDVSPLDARPFHDRDFFGPVFGDFSGGLRSFYEVSLPFDPVDRPAMHGVIVVAVFAFTLSAALAIAARRPVLAAAVTFAGAAWPVTLVPEGAGTARGVLLLAAALLLFAALRPGARRGGSQALAVGSAVVLAALVAVSSPAVAKGGFLDWQEWDPYAKEDKRISVQYVWDSDYDGIDFPKNATTVFTAQAPRRTPYWRATTLDIFLDDHWQESAEPTEWTSSGGQDVLDFDPFMPQQAFDRDNWLPQRVRIEALQDTHLVGASVPVAYEQGFTQTYAPGIAYVGRLERGQEYSVWSFAAQPTPEALVRSRPNYPFELALGSPFLNVGTGLAVPPFGRAGREEDVRELFRENDELAAYRPLFDQAQRVVGRPRNPYAAAVAVEAWFRSSGEFRYDEHPPTGGSAPPLVAFTTGHRRGYCQHFAGAMALMLRYLGVPARVAAGFTSGRFDEEEREWTVSDTNAHTWVEVWFDGYGWLPFDPTPGRGRLRAEYTASSLFFDADGATAAFAGAAAAALGLEILRNRLGGSPASPDDRPRGPDQGFTPGQPDAGQVTPLQDQRNDLRLLVTLLAAAAGILVAFWVVKVGRRRLRYLSSDPRKVAAAVRGELADYLADQRMRPAPSATPAELSSAVHARFRVDADPLAEALGVARFGPAAEAEAAAVTARRELKRVLRRIRGRLGVKRRFLGLVSLRSFGLRSA